MRKIETEHIYPPIPNRHYDWMASFEDDDEEGLKGYGPTEAEAVKDLMQQDFENRDED